MKPCKDCNCNADSCTCERLESYQDGKADAIDECIRALAKMPDCKNSLLIRLKQLKGEKE